MSDNTQAPLGTLDGSLFADDDIGGVKYPRIKLISGANGVNDGDVAHDNPLPVFHPRKISAAMTITANDVVVGSPAAAGVSGTPTANSYATHAVPEGHSALLVGLLSGFTSGYMVIEGSPDSTNGVNGTWFPIALTIHYATGGTYYGGTTSLGLYEGNCANLSYVRVRALYASTTLDCTPLIQTSHATSGMVQLIDALPAGSNVIGAVTVNGTVMTEVASVPPDKGVFGWTISAQNTAPAGDADADSSVPLYLGYGERTLAIEVRGAWACAGGLVLQVAVAGNAWENFDTLDGAFQRVTTGVRSSNIASGEEGMWLVPNIAGFTAVRLSSADDAFTGSAAITINASLG